MSTPFTEIYSRALYRFKDYNFLSFDPDTTEDVLYHHLMSAQSDFEGTCRYDLSDRDELSKRYNQSLDNKSIEILSLGVAYYWLSSKTLDSDLLKNNLSTADYSQYSPAMILDKINTLRTDILREFERKIIKYSYSNGDIASWKV